MIKTGIVPDLMVSFDPSYNGSGVCILTPEKLILTQIATSVKIKTFKDCFLGTQELLERVDALDVQKTAVNRVFLLEIPPIGASYAAGLFMLDGRILEHFYSNSYECFGVSCMTCKSIIGLGRNASKKDSVQFANDFKQHVVVPIIHIENGRSSSVYPETLIKSDNICESFMLMVTFAYIAGWGDKVFPNFLKYTKKNLDDIQVVDFRDVNTIERKRVKKNG